MDSTAVSDFCSTVREKVNEIGLSQKTIADIAEVSNKTISRIVNDEYEPSNKGHIIRVCETVDLDSERWLENLGFQYTEADITEHSIVVSGNVDSIHRPAFSGFGIDLLTGNELNDEWGRINNSTSHLYQRAEESLDDTERVVIQFGLQLEIMQDAFLEAMVSLLKRDFRILWYFNQKRDYPSAIKKVKRAIHLRNCGQLVEQCRFAHMAEHESAHYPFSFTLFNPLSMTGPALVYPNIFTRQYRSTSRVIAHRLSDRSKFGHELSNHGIALLERNLNPDLEVSDSVWLDVKDILSTSAQE
jgi:DNA-binding XRE family transcriptional regulator